MASMEVVERAYVKEKTQAMSVQRHRARDRWKFTLRLPPRATTG
jgi:hypothetical protein